MNDKWEWQTETVGNERQWLMSDNGECQTIGNGWQWEMTVSSWQQTIGNDKHLENIRQWWMTQNEDDKQCGMIYNGIWWTMVMIDNDNDRQKRQW